MQIELDEKDYEQLKQMAMDRLATKVAEQLWAPHERDYTSNRSDAWEVTEKKNLEHRRQLLDKVDWKRAPEYISESVVKKFFEKMLETR